MIWLLFQPWGNLRMNDNNPEGARPMLSSSGTLGGPHPHLEPIRPPIAAPTPAVIKAEQPAAQVLAPTKPASTTLVKIAGLGNLVQSVRDEIAGLRTEIPMLQQDAAALRATVTDLRSQINSTHDDLKFEAQTLGNGSGS